MQKQNPLLRVWELGKSQHSGLICAVISAFQMAVHWDGRLFSADTALYLGAVHIT